MFNLRAVPNPGPLPAPGSLDIAVSWDARAWALATGCWVNVWRQARDLGFAVPVALTAPLWASFQDVPETYCLPPLEIRCRNLLARAYDLIQFSQMESSEFIFRHLTSLRERNFLTVKMVCFECGDTPLITLSHPDENPWPPVYPPVAAKEAREFPARFGRPLRTAVLGLGEKPRFGLAEPGPSDGGNGLGKWGLL